MRKLCQLFRALGDRELGAVVNRQQAFWRLGPVARARPPVVYRMGSPGLKAGPGLCCRAFSKGQHELARHLHYTDGGRMFPG